MDRLPGQNEVALVVKSKFTVMIVPRRYYNTRIVATGYGYGDQFYKVHRVCTTMVYLDFGVIH